LVLLCYILDVYIYILSYFIFMLITYFENQHLTIVRNVYLIQIGEVKNATDQVLSP
jgi:hypothetical protein